MKKKSLFKKNINKNIIPYRELNLLILCFVYTWE